MNSSGTTPRRPGAGQHGLAPAGSTPASSRFRSSLVPMARPTPSRSFAQLAKPAASSSSRRDLFSTATPRTSRTTKFAPNLPATATKTPTGVRKLAPKSTNGGMASTSSSDLFKMRIPEPDLDLTGEALHKAVPEELSHKGTVYADQYLADKCPPEFDDLQRRQFFCILDLRRLKYSANEIFAKRDWKINIMNFAKEYEKSRGLIMLRYGLYEFKNVKPSEEVMRKWRKAHNLPEPEPETTSQKTSTSRGAAATATSTKRKAEDDLQVKDHALKTSTVNLNKRRNLDREETDDIHKFAPSPVKSKRKVDETEGHDENQPSSPSKQQKATAAAPRSRLESIINNVQSGSSPARSPLKPLFGISKQAGDQGSTPFASKSNPFAAPTNGATELASSKLHSAQFESGKALNGAGTGSVLSGHKIGSAPATGSTNIFGYLSGSSTNTSGNEDNGDAEEDESESESEHESEPETGSQDAAPSYEPSAAASTGTATPPIQSGRSLFSNGTAASNPFASAFNKPADNAAKGGLFGRVSFGPDGQPLRAAPAEEEEEEDEGEAPKSPSPVREPSKPKSAGGDFTFNHNSTPIKFGTAASGQGSIFQSAPKPGPSAASSTESSTPVSAAKEDEKAPSTNAASIFGSKAASAQPLFGAFQKSSENAASTGTSIFATQKPSSTPSFQFGASTSKPSSQDTEQTNKRPASPQSEPTKSVFGSQPTAETITSKEQPKSIFGSQPIHGASTTASTESAASAAAPAKPLFGFLNHENEAATSTPNGTSIFGNTAKSGSASVFGTQSSQAKRGREDDENQPMKKVMFGSGKTDSESADQQAKPSIFGAPKPAQRMETTKSDAPAPRQAKPIFGGSSSTLFGSTPTAAPASTNMFGSTTQAPQPAFQFGSSATAEKKPEEAKPTFHFGSSAPTEKKPEEAPKSNIFGNATSAGTPSFTFGAQNAPVAANTGSQPPSASFTFGSNQNTGVTTPSFGSATQTNGANGGKIDFNFTGSSTPGGGSSSFVFGGPNQNGSSNQGSFTFTAGGAGQSGITNPFSSFNSQGGGSGTPTPNGSFNFQFGGSTPNQASTEPSKPVFGSQPQPNGSSAAPSFNFTAAPSQNVANSAPAKPAGIFASLLQPKGGTSTGASSPFPAPSSINTTPISGTPEPQAQQEDGEEGPQEQISLTDGGPGEEDEIILYEVRAKATKYVPIVKGGEEDEEEQKSPWRTQGVGPLRVLRNKSTGHVRILLRAEPRGHIAMNKTILSTFEYKANGKTVRLMTASDDGSALETWLLQVKKPESAAELASTLEANKQFNKD